MAGKGDDYRPVDHKKYRKNWDQIFGVDKKKREKESESNKESPKRRNCF